MLYKEILFMKNRKILYAVNFQEDEDGYVFDHQTSHPDEKWKNKRGNKSSENLLYAVPLSSGLKFRNFILSATEKMNLFKNG